MSEQGSRSHYRSYSQGQVSQHDEYTDGAGSGYSRGKYDKMDVADLRDSFGKERGNNNDLIEVRPNSSFQISNNTMPSKMQQLDEKYVQYLEELENQIRLHYQNDSVYKSSSGQVLRMQKSAQSAKVLQNSQNESQYRTAAHERTLSKSGGAGGSSALRSRHEKPYRFMSKKCKLEFSNRSKSQASKSLSKSKQRANSGTFRKNNNMNASSSGLLLRSKPPQKDPKQMSRGSIHGMLTMMDKQNLKEMRSKLRPYRSKLQPKTERPDTNQSIHNIDIYTGSTDLLEARKANLNDNSEQDLSDLDNSLLKMDQMQEQITHLKKNMVNQKASKLKNEIKLLKSQLHKMKNVSSRHKF